jgi:hypothetical protein
MGNIIYLFDISKKNIIFKKSNIIYGKAIVLIGFSIIQNVCILGLFYLGNYLTNQKSSYEFLKMSFIFIIVTIFYISISLFIAVLKPRDFFSGYIVYIILLLSILLEILTMLLTNNALTKTNLTILIPAFWPMNCQGINAIHIIIILLISIALLFLSAKQYDNRDITE